MFKFFEMGVMITIFLITINSFIVIFGVGGSLETVGFEAETIDISPTQDDVNTMVTGGQSIIVAGSALSESPGYLDRLFPGVTPIWNTLSGFVAGYSVVLHAVLPTSIHPVILVVTVILTMIQLLTLLYLIMNLIAVVRGGGVR